MSPTYKEQSDCMTELSLFMYLDVFIFFFLFFFLSIYFVVFFLIKNIQKKKLQILQTFQYNKRI